MKALLKWNFFIVLFLLCSIPMFMGCGSDDDDTDPDDPGTTTIIGWKNDGNKATFGFKQSYGGISWSGLVTLTFDGSGADAVCTKCIIEETWPSDKVAKEAESGHKDSGDKNVSRSGKKVTYETDDFIGMTRKDLEQAIKTAFPSN